MAKDYTTPEEPSKNQKLHDPAVAYGSGHSLAAFFEQAETSAQPLEYYNGSIEAKAGASKKHNRLNTNLMRLLLQAPCLNEGSCELFTQSQQLQISHENRTAVLLPDLVLSCEEDSHDHLLFAPKLIIEILSPGTAHNDLNRKREYYQSLPTLEEYVLFWQNQIKCRVYRRAASGWQYQEAIGPQATITLNSAGLQLPLEACYQNMPLLSQLV